MSTKICQGLRLLYAAAEPGLAGAHSLQSEPTIKGGTVNAAPTIDDLR